MLSAAKTQNRVTSTSTSTTSHMIRSYRTIVIVLMGVSAVSVLYSTGMPSSRFLESAGYTSVVAWRPKSGARFCDMSSQNIPSEMFKSQSSEDKTLLELFFDRLCGGTYLEIGGLNGVRWSNSYMFHHAMGWKGVLVEASPENFAQLVVNRPNEIATVHAGVCEEERDLHWVAGKTRSTGAFSEFASESFRKKWLSEESQQNPTVVRCEPLRTLLPKVLGAASVPFFFDFFSLDIEGAEYAALSSLDFKQISFGVIFVEADGSNHRKNLAIRTLLAANGYEELMYQKRSYWFVNKDFHNIYSHLLYNTDDASLRNNNGTSLGAHKSVK